MYLNKKRCYNIQCYSKVWCGYIFYFFFFKEINTLVLFSVKRIKRHSKDFYCKKIFVFWTNAVLFNFVLIK